ncbi:anti-sigma factor RsbA family regulatory protein [Spirillospora sp. NPDC048911]|uniref:anti-sigma factor RsbA family regulatory protein n=1 Tax=Spirillospora sp. NPDC048911 TaxID=3364527 RepID=UPI0037150F3F
MNDLQGTTPGTEARSECGILLHRALMYDSERHFAEVAVPYLREGVKAGDAVVVIASAAHRALLRDQLGSEQAARIEFIDRAGWFRGPMQALADYYDHTHHDWWPRGRLRLLTEPVWTGRTPLEVREWKRHEAILNVAFAGTPSTIVCAYDTSALDAHIIVDAARTHPEIVDAGGARASEHFADPEEFYAGCNAPPLVPPPAGAASRAFASGELPGLRAFLSAEATRHGLPEEQVLPFVLAVNEVATGFIRRGGGRGAVWLWTEGGELLCDVADPERTMEDRFLGYLRPRPHQPGGAAMWAVRLLCHIVEIRSGDHGVLVRMHLKLPSV